ncbi:MAG: phosphomannomutase/phosphoglucomutase [Chloroflexi bacterium]|nr:phosphomannomutase/phosphoglucomutase [Chloroflexota bacterium]
MTVLHKSIFKKYDIGGPAEGDDAFINDEIAQLIGQAFGTYLQRFENMQKVVVGRDNRRTSYNLQQAFMQGLIASGCSVLDLGLIATPVLYWHAAQQAGCGGVMVTGSHIGPEYNGFKLCVGRRSVHSEQLMLLRSFLEKDTLAFGHGSSSVDFSAYRHYVADLETRLKPARPLKVVIDAGNGTAGLFAPRLLRKWGHNVVACLFCQPDSQFPNHAPDPHNPHNLRALAEKVRAERADVGIAFDGDADRIGVVDEKGQPVESDRLLALLARDLLTRHPGAAVVVDVMSSQVVLDEIKKAGGLPFMWMCGHALVKEKMAEIGALLAGEFSGHLFMGEDYFGFDDGFLAAGRLLALLATSGQPLSALNARLPTRHITPEYRLRCPEKDKEDIVESLREPMRAHGEVLEIDGLRVQFRHGWGVLRASNTEAALCLRFEAETPAALAEIRAVFDRALRPFPQVALLP